MADSKTSTPQSATMRKKFQSEKEDKESSLPLKPNNKTKLVSELFPDPQRCTNSNFRVAKGINAVNEAGYRESPLYLSSSELKVTSLIKPNTAVLRHFTSLLALEI